MRRRSAAGLALALIVALTGCYTTRPVSTSLSGQRVVISLTEEGAREMAALIGEDARAVEGIVVEADSEKWLLSVRSVHHAGGGVRWDGEQVAISVSSVASVVEKSLSRTRTAILIGGVIIGAIVTADEFIDIAPSDGGDGGGTPLPGQ